MALLEGQDRKRVSGNRERGEGRHAAKDYRLKLIPGRRGEDTPPLYAGGMLSQLSNRGATQLLFLVR